ncbi:hypothetical protein J2J97_16000 [Rhizobium bangladeshense]|uniref:hypothetical protein n=1 Tax=Rhizobium bangladeshense TaxID=1138189 RepID=UPI001A981A57|nr:hypothetical protein [Rhizobium bangladeshense]MBX4918896.1 hypothetical protein [Rhizobium bangladeshense]MBX4934120.1 hypothetical protein [Rhizobium bangladeshense]MBY3584331.1 hypothetical protein [Rhizobium bangladeshense]QSY87679.1 hypothetical protein J2J98_16005 [Rhizobium bangladeshense]QSY93504.1 hypothetical protein J2J97_16000 [Rhizobium bangladeshense]
MLENSVTVFERGGLWVVSVAELGGAQEKVFLKEEFARIYAAGQEIRIQKDVRQRT